MAASKSMDAIALLKDDHRKVEKLFEDFESAKGDGRKESWRARSASSCGPHRDRGRDFLPGLRGQGRGGSAEGEPMSSMTRPSC